MNPLLRAGLLGLLALVVAGPFAAPAHAQAASAADAQPLRFRDASEEARFRALVTELRCVMCQNQSLADSDAMIAHDLRRQVLAMMRAGQSDAQIKAYLVARYSEFVLYRPALEPRNWLLWFGPGLLLLAGGVAVWRIVRKRGTQGDAAAIAPLADDRETW
jgi:cytochrome c-type biogenesis protein CcmH